MSNDGFGKVRQKRSHGPNKPYERRKSLLGRMTDTVKDLIAPSWLSGLVGKSSSDQPAATDIQEEAEEENFMSPPQSPPNHTPFGAATPQARPSAVNHQGQSNRRHTLSHFPGRTTESTPLVPNDRLAPQADRRQQNSLGFTALPLPSEPTTSQADDNMSEHSDGSKSTSGCSSLVPHPDKREYQREILQLNESSLEKLKEQLQTSTPAPPPSRPSSQPSSIPQPSFTPQPMFNSQSTPHPRSQRQDPGMSSISEAPGGGNSSRTWSSSFQASRLRDTSVKSKPSFNMSLFGASTLGNSSILGSSFHESTYYPGKVGYGGASQFRKGKIKSTAPYELAAPYRTAVKARTVAQSNKEALTSSTAKRILQTLAHMPTPLSDAKKIPVDNTISDSVLSFTPGSYLKKVKLSGNSAASKRRSLGFPMRGPPVQQLSTPTIASIARNRQKLTFSPQPVTEPSPKPSASSEHQAEKAKSASPAEGDSQHSSLRHSDTITLGESGRTGGKMKREKTHHYSSKKAADEEEVVMAPNLKTDFTLPVTNMPKFNFGLSGVGPPPKPPSTPVASTPQQTSSQDVPVTNMQFTFSSPIPSSLPNSPAGGTPKLNFQFSSPINLNGQKKFQESPQEDYVMSNVEAPSSGLKSGSVTSILCNNSRTDNNFSVGTNFKFGAAPSRSGNSPANAFSAVSELKSGSVMDILGGKVSPSKNSDTDSVKAAPMLKQGSVMDILGGRSSPLKGSSSGPVKPAPGLAKGSVMDVLSKDTTASKADETWARLTAPTNKWECDTCMLRNPPEDTKCVACGSAKPTPKSADKPASSVSSTSAAPPGDSLWEKFKPPAGSWECPTCMIPNKSTSIACVACATGKPGSPRANSSPAPVQSLGWGAKFLPPAGSWECDTCLVRNKAADSVCVACQSSKPGGAKASITAGSSGKKTSEQWQCDSCMTTNKGEATKCITCETLKSGSKTATGGLTFAPNALASGPCGFSFGSSNTAKPPGSFTFGKSEPDDKDSARDIKFGSSETSNKDTSSSSGFKFGSSGTQNKDNGPVGGFTFGGPASETKDTAPAGGFKFGASNTDSSKPSESLQFGNSERTDSSKSSFNFGGSTASKSDDVKVASAATLESTKDSTLKSGGFSFSSSSNSVEKQSDGGFSFTKPSQEADNKVGSGFAFSSGLNKESSAANTATTTTTFSFGGSAASTPAQVTQQKTEPVATFTFGQKPSTESTSTDSSKVNSTFSFGLSSNQADAKTLNNNTEVKLNREAAKPAPGGFTFNAGSSNKSVPPPAFGGFAGQKAETSGAVAGFAGFGSVKKEETSGKRSHTDVDSEPIAKKAFNFSATKDTGSSAFTIPTSTSGEKSTGGLFTFGQQPATSTPPSSAPLGTGGFNSITSGSAAPFGGGSGGFGGTSTAPTGPVFSGNAFGQTSAPFGTTPSIPTFGSAPSNTSSFSVGSQQAPATQAPPSLFGAKASTFGGTASPAFGSNSTFGGSTNTTFGGFNSTPAPSFGGSTFGGNSAPTFGSAPPATTSATPAAGGFNFSSASSGFDFGGANSAPTGVFQFGAKADTGPSAATAPQPAAPVFGQPAPVQQPAQAFNFSASSTNSFSAPPAYGFNAGSSAEKNPFSIQTSSGGGKRIIKKAVRRSRK